MKKVIQKLYSGLSQLTLAQKAQAHYAAGRYQEATDAFKDLLRQADNPERRRCLADCYLQRARAMADKGMFKEACVLWENYADYGQTPLQGRDVYLIWLLVCQNHAKAYAELASFDARRLEADYPEFSRHLGALLLAGMSDLLPYLPEDAALRRHWQSVEQALAALRQGDREACDRALNNLPFRSAYRDLRTVLKAQMLVGNAFDAAAMLAKIPYASPYRPLADACLAYRQQGADFVAALAALAPHQRRTIVQARRLTDEQLNLLDSLIKHAAQLNHKMRFDLVLQYRELFGSAAAQAYCLGALPDYPDGQKDYLEHFAVTDPFEQNRVQALLYERDKKFSDAAFHWSRCLEILKRQRPAHHKKIALILRHMAEQASYRDAATLLADSLEHDPDHRGTYLALLALYQGQLTDPGKYQHWLEIGLARFPGDTELLVRAAKSAAERKAFEKAAGHAKALLKIDPVNTLAKQLLFAYHMAHARRLLKDEKFHLVENEIQAAEGLSIDKGLRRQAELLRGFYRWLAQHKEQGLQPIVDTLATLNGDPLNMHFQAHMEAGLLDLPTEALILALPPVNAYLLSAPELRHLIDSMEYYDEQLEDRTCLFSALDKIKTPLQDSLPWLLGHDDLLSSWCHELAKIGYYELLKHCAKLLNAKRHKPVWTYYLVLAECQGDAGRMNVMAPYRLLPALEQARAENDRKTALLIERLLDQASGLNKPFLSEDHADDFEQAFDGDPIEDLFGHVPDSAMQRIEKELENLMKKNSPEQFADKMLREYGERLGQQRLAIFLQKEDFFWTMALFAAAEALKINVGVAIEDILKRFEDDSPQVAQPFN